MNIEHNDKYHVIINDLAHAHCAVVAGFPSFRHEHDDKCDAGAGNQAAGTAHILQYRAITALLDCNHCIN